MLVLRCGLHPASTDAKAKAPQENVESAQEFNTQSVRGGGGPFLRGSSSFQDLLFTENAAQSPCSHFGGLHSKGPGDGDGLSASGTPAD